MIRGGLVALASALMAASAGAQVPDEVSTIVDEAFAPDIPMGETRSVVILHRGETVLERHREGYGPDTKQVSWSMAKSLTHALVGRLLDEGLLDTIDAPMLTPFPSGDPRGGITWREWLTMTDGLLYTEIAEPGVELPLSDQDVVQMMYGPGRYDVAAWITGNFPLENTPGERWNYSTAGYHLIARAVQEVAGTAGDPAATTAFLDRLLFRPLGVDAVAEYDAAGTLLGGSLVYMDARDFARLGQLYLQDGMWEGERLLPEGWVAFAGADAAPDDGINVYGAGWWRVPEDPSDDRLRVGGPYDAFHAGGHEGQSIWVVPSRDLVIVRLGLMPNTPEAWTALYGMNQRIARGFKYD